MTLSGQFPQTLPDLPVFSVDHVDAHPSMLYPGRIRPLLVFFEFCLFSRLNQSVHIKDKRQA